ncbi:hypothetical protein BGX33_009229 [Mortierella sp. NVP41]|nr:hypothetical protein BGX33_009229 [Mortierella sp. NVP41]
MVSFYGTLGQEGLTSPISSFALLIQIYYALCITVVVMAATLPFLRDTVLPYGKLDATTTSSTSSSSRSLSFIKKVAKRDSSSTRDSWVKTIKDLQVPKTWFAHFYVFATLWMVYITVDLWVYSSSAVVLPPTTISFSSKIHVIRNAPAALVSTQRYWSLLTFLNYLGIMPAHIPLASAQSASEPLLVRSWTPPPHVLLAMAAYLFQVVRRWYESWYVERPSVEAKMHVAHYIVGVTFYASMAPSTWIDAYESWIRQGAEFGPVTTSSTTVAPSDTMLLGLNGQCLLGLLVFVWASWHQYNCHAILASLRPRPVKGAKDDKPKKQEYKVPFGDWFQYMVAPHYSAEMMIYFGLFLMASSSPSTANSSTAPTLLCACSWVVINLGIIARETDQWYRVQFGDRYAVVGNPAGKKSGPAGRASRRFILIPFVY